MPRIALLQLQSEDNPTDNIEKTIKSIEKAANAGAQIICTQELCNTRYFCNEQNPEHFELAEAIPGKLTKKFSKIAEEHGIVIVVSTFEKHTYGLYYNTAFVIDANGTYLGKYRKMHIPQDPGFEEKYYFTPSDDGFRIFNTQFGKLGVLICWDQWYPEAARLCSLKGAQILIYPTAIGWLQSEKGEVGYGQLDAWVTIQRSHAIANGNFVAAINRIGKEADTEFWGSSFVANPFGKIIAKAPEDQEIIIYADLDYSNIDEQRITWPFFRDRRIEHYADITKRSLLDDDSH